MVSQFIVCTHNSFASIHLTILPHTHGCKTIIAPTLNTSIKPFACTRILLTIYGHTTLLLHHNRSDSICNHFNKSMIFTTSHLHGMQLYLFEARAIVHLCKRLGIACSSDSIVTIFGCRDIQTCSI